jgi:hypothetical protein
MSKYVDLFAAGGKANCRRQGEMGSVSRRAIGGSIHRIREFELEKVSSKLRTLVRLRIFISIKSYGYIYIINLFWIILVEM